MQTPRFSIRLNQADRDALDRIAKHHGIDDQAAALRMLIRAEDRRLFSARQVAHQAPGSAPESAPAADDDTMGWE